MTDRIIHVTCTYSQLSTITDALNWARFLAKCAHNDEDMAEFQHAHDIAFAMRLNGLKDAVDSEHYFSDAEEPQAVCDFMSEFAPF